MHYLERPLKAAVLTLICTVLAACGNHEGIAADKTGFVIRNAQVFDGTQVRPATDVLVVDGLIKEIGAALPSDLPEVDGTGKTLLPGLIDAHTHTWGESLSDAVRFGTTTVLDQFTSKELIASARERRAKIDNVAQADMFTAGTLVTVADGHGTQFGMPIPVFDNTTDPLAFVKARRDEGSDWIKIVYEDGSAFGRTLPSLSPKQLNEIIQATHALDMQAMVHVSTLSGAMLAVESEADVLVHTWGDAEASTAQVMAIADSGVAVTSTLAVMASFSNHPLSERYQSLPELSPFQIQSMTQASRIKHHNETEGENTALQIASRNIASLHAAGVPILAGTDAPNPGTAFGVSMHHELELLVDAGLTPLAALQAGTATPAAVYGLSDRGAIKKGRLADLLLVEGDPSKHIAHTLQIAGVWKDGKPVPLKLSSAEEAVSDVPAVTLNPGLLSNFDDDLSATSGLPWEQTTDAMMNGKSEVKLSHRASPEGGGSMQVKGSIRPGFPFPWAGAMWFPGSRTMQPVDGSSITEIQFKARAIESEMAIRVMGFHGSQSVGPPPTVAINVGPEWTEFSLAADQFNGMRWSQISGLAFVAGPSQGDFAFEIDDVVLK